MKTNCAVYRVVFMTGEHMLWDKIFNLPFCFFFPLWSLLLWPLDSAFYCSLFLTRHPTFALFHCRLYRILENYIQCQFYLCSQFLERGHRISGLGDLSVSDCIILSDIFCLVFVIVLSVSFPFALWVWCYCLIAFNVFCDEEGFVFSKPPISLFSL